MGFIEKRSGGYRARYREPLGHLTSKTFTRKADAERWARETEVATERGTGPTPAAPRCPLPCGRRSSCCWPGGCRRPPSRRTYRRLGAGDGLENVQETFRLSREQLLAALRYAADLAARPRREPTRPARPIESVEDLDRFKTSLWDSDGELEAFLADLRASRNADS